METVLTIITVIVFVAFVVIVLLAAGTTFGLSSKVADQLKDQVKENSTLEEKIGILTQRLNVTSDTLSELLHVLADELKPKDEESEDTDTIKAE